MPHWTTILQTLAVPSAGAPPAPPHDSSDRRAFRMYGLAWRDYEAKQQRYYFGLKPDGRFVVEDVLPGSYRLHVTLTAPPKDPLDPEAVMLSTQREIGSLTRDVVVSEALPDQSDQPLDLGTVNLRLDEGVGAME